MHALQEFGQAIKARRTDIGLTQAQVADLSGLSRQTVSQLENGSALDLGFNKVERLASALGLALRLEQNTFSSQRLRKQPKLAALRRAAQTGNVSYKRLLTPTQLKNIVVEGRAPSHLEPHVHAILDDAPVSLLASLADQVHVESDLEPKLVWKNFRALAAQVKSKRPLWK